MRDSKSILMFDKTGKKLMKLEYEFEYPVGVAVENTIGSFQAAIDHVLSNQLAES